MSRILMSMQERERTRIASDLHDSIGQSLSALSCGIDAALESARMRHWKLTRSKLEKLAGQVKATLIEVQRIAMNLRPAMLDDIGLVATLAWFVREFGLTQSRPELNADIDIDECDVLPAWRTPIFRVVQEAANNVAKHSGASEMRLRLHRVDSELHLEVSDNGIGFTATKGGRAALAGAGMGLRGMRERAEFSGGRFRLLSTRGKGTTVLVVWPMPRRSMGQESPVGEISPPNL